ncbi:uncharacterized protein BP01DRAFT_52287 [Aspergillus saccharolyticus JOP 1030-1]|uniref:Uncharacterized protein n=1 Tax=Aspergillus saccharolyticus JOP 1030-1 TaxID=1450539 RepID=A0A318ZY69_9EURO|nr:hypothetical protein BP01DRAFT_52287 [Aspergillus saccharolyticus JOP 1030-1]PYH45048.1 hypothetical protein BP01DRAFT_52287 [Aspergillus saccharolyticus JOP 1030-1]
MLHGWTSGTGLEDGIWRFYNIIEGNGTSRIRAGRLFSFLFLFFFSFPIWNSSLDLQKTITLRATAILAVFAVISAHL